MVVAVQRWRGIARAFDSLTLAVGLLMTLYVGTAVLGLVRSSAQHYAVFMTFVMVMSSIAAFKQVVAERFDFFPSPTDPLHLFALLKDLRKIVS